MSYEAEGQLVGHDRDAAWLRHRADRAEQDDREDRTNHFGTWEGVNARRTEITLAAPCGGGAEEASVSLNNGE